ncbi:MAG: hypothetical protein Q7S01_05030 [bacterium]|nr:hypothetical protein [bacterium]
MKLVSENLRDEFGEIRLEVIFQDRTVRLSCIRRSQDNQVLSFHIVSFTEDGIKTLGSAHERIVAGEMLGEVIQMSEVPYTRTVSEKSSVEMDSGLASLFGTEKGRCTTERIEYHVRGIPYATIYEFYNPKYTLVVKQ